MNILVVDDSSTVRAVIKRTLGIAGVPTDDLRQAVEPPVRQRLSHPLFCRRHRVANLAVGAGGIRPRPGVVEGSPLVADCGRSVPVPWCCPAGRRPAARRLGRVSR